LQDILDRNEAEQAGDAVQLMTLHAAKGLEFPHVYIVGMEEDLLPHRSSIEQEAIEEERRLAYVGITRAQRTLTFSLAKRRKRQGEWIECLPSRFLDELPQDDLRWQGTGHVVNEEESRQKGKAHLDNLRGLLKP
jgi:ATP-dependent DNA helicase Rep